MGDTEIPYLKVRAVRDETGASHDECRRALEQTDGDVARAVALWFDGRRGDREVSPRRHRPDQQPESAV
jgi:hypothetical protein